MPPSIAALLLPGLGHWRAGRREQGLSILAATAGIALVLGWWAGIGGRPAWWLALLPFWLAQALDADPGQRARVAAANAASRLLLRLVDQVADSEARIEDVAALFSSRPFTWDFTGGAGGTRIDAALQRLCVLSVLTRADVERMRGKLHGASP